MKIIYINGYKGENSKKPKLLQKELKKDKVYHCKLIYNDGFNVKVCIDFINKINPDIIIASSTGALIAEQFDIPKILLNPVLEKEDLQKLFNLNIDELSNEKIKSERIIILGKNDELLDWKKSYNFYKDRAEIWLKEYNHRIDDIEIILKAIEEMRKSLLTLD